jgi:hypothetical protein
MIKILVDWVKAFWVTPETTKARGLSKSLKSPKKGKKTKQPYLDKSANWDKDYMD